MKQRRPTQGGAAVDRLNWNTQAGIFLTCLLYQGGYADASVREAEARIRNLQAQVDSLRQQIHLQVEQVGLAVAAANARRWARARRRPTSKRVSNSPRASSPMPSSAQSGQMLVIA